MTPAWETRVTAGKVELRDGPGGGKTLVAYAFRHNLESEDLGGFVERVAPGAATKTIAEQDIRALFNHSVDNLLGRKGAGTLRLAEDQNGLGYEIDLPGTTLGRDLAALVGRGDVYGSSFSFVPVGGARGVAWARNERGMALRELRQVRIRDVGPVTFPAYPLGGTAGDMALRGLAEQRSLPFQEVIAAAADGRLAELLDGERQEPPVPAGARVGRYW